MKHKIIFVTGGSASGKTTLAKQLKENIGDKALYISQDAFYKPTKNDNTNYDLPEAFDFELQNRILNDLINDKTVELPIYDFEKHDRVGVRNIEPKPLIIFEGLFTFYDYDLSKIADFKIFVDTPADTRLARRVLRDVTERGRSIENILERWINYVQPSYKNYIAKQKQYADIVIPWNKVKEKAIKSLVATFTEIIKS